MNAKAHWNHDPITDDEKFLGSWTDSKTGRIVDLYFRPKPKDVSLGFIDAIMARWSDRAHDIRIGEAGVYLLSEIVDGDDVSRALRVGHLVAVDLGLLAFPTSLWSIFGTSYQVQFCVADDLSKVSLDDEKAWVPALADVKASTFDLHQHAVRLKKLLISRGMDPNRLRVVNLDRHAS